MDKISFRIECLKKIKGRKKYLDYAKDKKISKKIEIIIKKHKPKSILFYMPMEMEVDVMRLVKRYRKSIKVFIPFIVEESFKMVEYRLPLEKNSFHILESKNPSFSHKRVDLIIVPTIGIDNQMRRVGFGKGMYDRFFASLGQKPITIFIQRDRCHTRKKVCQTHDILCDYYITSKESNIR